MKSRGSVNGGSTPFTFLAVQFYEGMVKEELPSFWKFIGSIVTEKMGMNMPKRSFYKINCHKLQILCILQFLYINMPSVVFDPFECH